ncbi:MAG: orotidine-5'-phosphate decarboxylase [Verrucomicrobia bacterium CG_4_10_14_3_um_filter_43_23]|nr:MAG: orotidine 5'-phosphate decarboxylase [Verrucomicrobia bacterium CG1_02_43_26]PIP58842.1 MAG: orotidine-5'-phosphate decarboxylase [Verrucomicrobia bacterium CG22_combo_CG10-13_8_21_14_all_43_17]PIX57766.1 MAG: orotidine-5'-phosphate decarboxylase [Verrucomicrobia bacterium CG_4_10_14_3_um_filter_43_23]PIY61068.1 MAG: orotidine-5'-phosphate decarboxylase [Verrucomicrobia bacterium CG_4_10_14_0_8_um_filter_43_34]PJA44234.1 MAG: orotidine-5'-phosphate decarboxylase [Verrucomicrobia bacteri
MSQTTHTHTHLILALDLPERDQSLQFLRRMGHHCKWVKIGLQLYTRYGKDFVREVADLGYNVFLDLKLHDIPNTVSSAIKSLSDLPIKMLTLHTSGGEEMIKRAVETTKDYNPAILLLGVTVLTNLDKPALEQIGFSQEPKDLVIRLAKMGSNAGLKGFVCSPVELPLLREALPKDTVIVTPGIRPQGAEVFDQKRIATPSIAAKEGASYIVVGRPILESTSPQETILSILNELQHPVK